MSLREKLLEVETIEEGNETIAQRNHRLRYKYGQEEFKKENPIEKETHPIVDKSFQAGPTKEATKERKAAEYDAEISNMNDPTGKEPSLWQKYGTGANAGYAAAATAAGIGAVLLAKKLRAKKKAADKKKVASAKA